MGSEDEWGVSWYVVPFCVQCWFWMVVLMDGRGESAQGTCTEYCRSSA